MGTMDFQSFGEIKVEYQLVDEIKTITVILWMDCGSRQFKTAL